VWENHFDFIHLVNNKKFHDIEIFTEAGECIYVHKIFMDRFPEMDKLLIDKGDKKYQLKNGIPKNCMIEFLKFLYSDNRSLLGKETVSLLHTVLDDIKPSDLTKQLLKVMCTWNTKPILFPNYLQEMRSSKTGCDITFKVQDQIFLAHRCIVFTRCDVLETLFSSELSLDSNEQIHEIPNVDCKIFELLLDFIYTDQVPKDMSTQQSDSLWQLADKFTLENLKAKCIRNAK